MASTARALWHDRERRASQSHQFAHNTMGHGSESEDEDCWVATGGAAEVWASPFAAIAASAPTTHAAYSQVWVGQRVQRLEMLSRVHDLLQQPLPSDIRAALVAQYEGLEAQLMRGPEEHFCLGQVHESDTHAGAAGVEDEHGDGGSLSEEPVYCTHLPEPAPQAISKHLAALIQVVDVGAREGASGSWVTSHTHGVPHAGLGSAPSHILLRRSPYHAERVPLRYQKDENADDTSMGDAAWGFGDGRSVQGSWVEGQETFVHLPSAHEASAGCGAVHGASGFTHEDTFCGRELEPVNMCQDPTPLLQRGPDWAWDDEGEGGLSGCPSRTHMIAARAHVEGLDEEAELLSGGMPLGMIVQHPGRPPDEFVCHSPSHVPENHARVLEYHAFTSGASELPKSEPPEHLAHMARVGQHILGNWLLAHMAGMPDQDGDWGVQPSQTHMDASWAQGDAGRGRHWSFRAGHYPGRPPDEVLTGTDSGLPVGGNQLRLDCEHMIRGTQVGWPREVREPPGRPPDANQTTL